MCHVNVVRVSSYWKLVNELQDAEGRGTLVCTNFQFENGAPPINHGTPIAPSPAAIIRKFYSADWTKEMLLHHHSSRRFAAMALTIECFSLHLSLANLCLSSRTLSTAFRAGCLKAATCPTNDCVHLNIFANLPRV